jgi:hypothetical protein
MTDEWAVDDEWVTLPEAEVLPFLDDEWTEPGNEFSQTVTESDDEFQFHLNSERLER